MIGVAYAAVVVLSLAVTAALVVSTRARGPVDLHRVAEFEKRWLLIVVAILVALLLATIWFTPYGQSSGANGQVVHVTAQQFFWKLSPSHVAAHRPVEFLVTSTDVYHGFGIYRGTQLIAQVEVVPKTTQKLVHTFATPGTYTILCLEFCGVGHHQMKATFEVTP